jgi:hypothetical protein
MAVTVPDTATEPEADVPVKPEVFADPLRPTDPAAVVAPPGVACAESEIDPIADAGCDPAAELAPDSTIDPLVVAEARAFTTAPRDSEPEAVSPMPALATPDREIEPEAVAA